MKRRGFFAALAGAVAVASVPTVQAATDGDTYRGYRLVWREWAQMFNQDVLLGAWLGQRDGDECNPVASTTGQTYWYRPCDVFPTWFVKGWPVVTAFSTTAERDSVKQATRVLLLRTIDERLDAPPEPPAVMPDGFYSSVLVRNGR